MVVVGLEVVAALIVEEGTEVLVTTALGSTKRVPLNKTRLGSRSIKPQEAMKVGGRNRITGALRTQERASVEEVETAVPQQLSLIEDTPKKASKTSKKSTATKKRKGKK